MPALASALALMMTGAAPATTLPALPPMASGYVFEDRNRNRKRDAGEPGLANVKVSNGLSITTTDRDGR
jgi:Icc protein